VSRLIFASPQKFVETQLLALFCRSWISEPIRLEESCGFFCLCQADRRSLQHTQFLFIICSLLYDGGRTNRLGDAAAAALIHLPVSG